MNELLIYGISAVVVAEILFWLTFYFGRKSWKELGSNVYPLKIAYLFIGGYLAVIVKICGVQNFGMACLIILSVLLVIYLNVKVADWVNTKLTKLSRRKMDRITSRK